MKISARNKKIIYNTVIIALLVIAVGAAVYMKKYRFPSENDRNNTQLIDTEKNSITPDVTEREVSNPSETEPAPEQKALPRLVDLGADKCIPCKMMKPILEELEKEYAGQFEVIFIDVWQNEAAGKAYDIKIIPTQIFFDSKGSELFRHVGFFSKEDILAKWKELGIELKDPNSEQDK
jgi:thioredoxin 1